MCDYYIEELWEAEDKIEILERENEIMGTELESWRMHLHPEIKYFKFCCERKIKIKEEEIKRLNEQLDAEKFVRYSDSDVLGRVIRAEKSAEKEYNEAIKANKEANEWALKCGKSERKLGEVRLCLRETILFIEGVFPAPSPLLKRSLLSWINILNSTRV